MKQCVSVQDADLENGINLDNTILQVFIEGGKSHFRSEESRIEEEFLHLYCNRDAHQHLSFHWRFAFKVVFECPCFSRAFYFLLYT